ncbi:MAG: PIN domain-containing protein [bacterium]|nr:PIN domain-containing protein [bacterium]MXZ31447.1 type II toxin-antitoxin system VapC family toxin [Acidimicrobiia bacterium]MDE0669085.1 PIN domain-containing protein [bacterium]MYB24949.1 type II toxin-antitoxin system VapC family toxin [Acidimicrobiia bacterium]MYE68393.1 type II toxin-antitoxin system VapC family toxin [Acidimicrobiia bacterium]
MNGWIFVDTSALYALLDADDDHHAEAAWGWERLLDDMQSGRRRGITHYGVVVETSALVQRRLGMQAVGELHDSVLEVLVVEDVDTDLQRRALAAMLAAGHRNVSLVDWTSFELMRAKGITHALAFDDDFTRRGFHPPPTVA